MTLHQAVPDAWQSFVSAKTSAEFCRAWLAYVCSRIGPVQAAAVLAESREGHGFLPIAVWPQAAPELARLGKVAERTLAESRTIVDRPAPAAAAGARPGTAHTLHTVHIGYPVLSGERAVGAVVIEAALDENAVRAALQEIHWGIGWLAELFVRGELTQLQEQAGRIGTALEAAATALRPGKPQQMMFEVCNQLARSLGCTRVALGLCAHEQVRLHALSDAAWFEKRTPLSRAYVEAMEEALDRGEAVFSSDAPVATGSMPDASVPAPAIAASTPTPASTPASAAAPASALNSVPAFPSPSAPAPAPVSAQVSAPPGAVSPEPDPPAATPSAPRHDALRGHTGAGEIASCPLTLGIKTIGVLTLEKPAGQYFTPAQLLWLEAFNTLFPSILEQARRANQNAFARAAESVRDALARLFGPRHLVWKFSASLTVIVLALLILLPVGYRVSAKVVIEGETLRVAAAPFEGFIDSSFARAGDTVRQGQVLVKLDDRDLKLEQGKWASERDQHERKLREAMANHDMAGIQVTSAQLKQAEAQWNLATEKLARTEIKAPYDGLVVSGDLSQQIGSPVETGKKLFEIAPLHSYRVILQVDEREIRHVEAGQPGKLLISGLSDDPMPLTVVKITPVASAQDGKNFFRVEARLAAASDRLRPGMEGVGKIDAGSRRLWWVLTHSFTDWLRLLLWSWLP